MPELYRCRVFDGNDDDDDDDDDADDDIYDSSKPSPRGRPWGWIGRWSLWRLRCLRGQGPPARESVSLLVPEAGEGA